jgi:hypothetical protein
MNLEQSASNLNSLYFLPEFTFTNTTFTPKIGTELELADGVIWLDRTAIVFQMKERASDVELIDSSDEKWFQNKVLKKATRQIKNTLEYLQINDSIIATNLRSQRVELVGGDLATLHKIVLYSEPEQVLIRPKHHISSTAGFIHLLPLADYDGVVRTLCTLSELFEYLAWRERQLRIWPNSSTLPEQALLGHYLFGNADKIPGIEDALFVYTMEQDLESWDLAGILHNFLDRTYDQIDREDTNYHRIIGEVAKLDRSGLRAFKERFKLSMEKSKENVFTLPYRFSTGRTECGFLFIPLEQKFREVRRTVLGNLTRLYKYDGHLSKCVGLCFLDDPDGLVTVDWCIIDSPWEEDPAAEQVLRERYPFRPTKDQRISRYRFSSDNH